MHHSPLASTHDEGPPPGFVPTSTVLDHVPLPGGHNHVRSPNMSLAGALPVLARSLSDTPVSHHASAAAPFASMRSPRISFDGPNAGFNSRAASEWDTRSAWGGESRSERSPRPVRAPEIAVTPRVSSRAQSRPGSSMSRREPGIPDVSIYQGAPSRNRSRVGFDDDDPAEIPLPSSMGPSRATSAGYGTARSTGARSERSGKRYVGTPGPGRQPALANSAGLSTPYSRRLEPHAEELYDNEIVPSSDESANTLTTPPGMKPILPPTLTRTPSRTSVFMPPDPDDARRVLEAERSEGRVADPAPWDDQLPPLRSSASRASLASHKSYSRFHSTDYVDPAVMASGGSVLLPLPNAENEPSSSIPVTVKGKKKKGKRK